MRDDLAALRQVLADGRRDEPTVGLPWTVLEGLARLIGCDKISFPEADTVRGVSIVDQELAGGERFIHDGRNPPDPEFWRCVRSFQACTYPSRSGDLVSAVKWSDFYTRAEVRNHPLYADWFDEVDQRNGLHIAFPCAPGHMRKVTFWRSSARDFDERDRTLAELARPHLWEILRESRRRLNGVPRLTPREWEVLRLADQGYGNREIAQLLHVSVGTVRKHLEHVFDRTGTRTRTAAAARMMPRDGG